MTADVQTLAWANALTVELKTVYPQIDADRGIYVRDKLLKFPERVARQAVTEYIERSGDEFFNLGKLLAVAHRVGCQNQEGPNSVKSQTQERRANISEQSRLAESWSKAETFVIDLPETKQHHYRESFLAAQTTTLRKMYAGIMERAKLPKNFVAYVYESETGRKVESIVPPRGIDQSAPLPPRRQQDPFAKDEAWPEFS